MQEFPPTSQVDVTILVMTLLTLREVQYRKAVFSVHSQPPLSFNIMGPSNSSWWYTLQTRPVSTEPWNRLGFHVTKSSHHCERSRNVSTNKSPLHPWNLTWNTIMKVWKMSFLFNWMIFRFHVNLPRILRFRKSLASKHSLLEQKTSPGANKAIIMSLEAPLQVGVSSFLQ